MRILIVEDDFTSRKVLQKMLSKYGDCDMAADGEEAVHACRMALEENAPYDLICMDIMMPVIDGQQALQQIRKLEGQWGLGSGSSARVVMTTALGDIKNVTQAFSQGLADSYVTKPIDSDKLIGELKKLNLIPD